MAGTDSAPTPIPTHKRVNIIGVSVSAINIPLALRIIESWIANNDPHYICVTSVHGLIESRKRKEVMRVFNNAGLVTPDGMPLVWLCKYFGQRQTTRVYGPDLMLALCKHSVEKGYRHFFYGSEEGVADDLARKMQSRFPGLIVVGTHSPPFRPLTPEEDEEEIRLINETNPDIIWISLSVPRAELWMAKHVGKLNASALIGVGAAFAFHTGRTPQAPLWMQRNGLEWFFRLLVEPRRLWRRYLEIYPKFLFHISLQLLGLKSFRMDQ